MIAWREKFVAFAIHFVITALVAAGAAALIFFVWFPAPFDAMTGGTKLFFLVVGCDLALGPLISLVIYNSKKSRKELFTDYLVVAVVQLAALAYGVHAVSNARPVYVAFLKDRLEVATPADIDPADLKAAKAPYDSLPKWGPKLVATRDATSIKEQQKLLFLSVGGKETSVMPAYYVPYESQRDAILKAAKPLEVLYKHHPDAKALVAAEHLSNAAALRWMPVKHRRGFWTVLIDPKTAEPVRYIALDPY